jgi:murein DD-endopeptidase MepM/ murein hydrolase activator NlpD
MSNPKRAVPLIALGLCSAGAVAVWQPREAIEPELPELAGFYAAPAERVETHVLRRGETLGAILGRAQITGNEMANLLLAVREHYNPRRLRPGSEVMVRRWAENGEPRAVELRLNPDSLVRLERRPLGWDGTVKITPVTIDTAYVTGRIERGRTLYQSLVDNDELDMPESERIQLVADLAEIYAYQLDFSREIQAGDEYRFVYERATRPDGTARSRRILVAEVVNRGRGMPAVHFDPPELRGGYYAPDGRSLRLAFRRYPVDYVRITSAFSWRRYHPILGVHRSHLGTDFGAPHGTPVRATGDGVVASAGWNGGYGNLIVLRHPGGYATRYAHLSRFAAGLRVGRRVHEGEVIGYVGATGLATGPHLHYELWRDGQALDPRNARLPGAPPVPAERMDEFRRLAEQRLSLLEEIGPRDYRVAAGGESSPQAPPMR